MDGTEQITHVAHLNVRRSLTYYVLGALTVFLGFSQNLEMAFRATAMVLTISTGILLYRAWRAPQVPYHRSDLWKFLGWVHKVPERQLQKILAFTMRRAFLAYADCVCLAAVVFWLLCFADGYLLSGRF